MAKEDEDRKIGAWGWVGIVLGLGVIAGIFVAVAICVKRKFGREPSPGPDYFFLLRSLADWDSLD